MPLTITFHQVRPDEMVYACAGLWLIGDKFAMTNGFVIAGSRNAAVEKWKAASAKLKPETDGAPLVYISVSELADYACAEPPAISDQ